MEDETYHRARVRAAERKTSVSAMVRDFLNEVTSGDSQADRLKREEAKLRDSIIAFRAGDRLGRDELHRR